MADGVREIHDLIPDSPLCVIVKIGSADADANDFEQYVCGVPQRRGGKIHEFDFPDSGKHCGFHTIRPLLTAGSCKSLSGLFHGVCKWMIHQVRMFSPVILRIPALMNNAI